MGVGEGTSIALYSSSYALWISFLWLQRARARGMEKDPSPSLIYIILSLIFIYLSVLSLKFANLSLFSPYGHILGGFYP